MNKLLAKLTKRRVNKIRDENGDITTDTNEIQKIIQEYFENQNIPPANWKTKKKID
jgi:hypothetical protein